MSINAFIPTVWSARLLDNLNKNLVYGQPGIVNKDYEGNITGMGSSVKITSIGRVTVGDYTKNTDIGSPETLNDSQTTLLIDQQKYFNFQIDDIDKAQQVPKIMEDAMRESAYALTNTADQYIASMYTDVASGNTVGNDTTAIVPTKADAYEYLVDLSVILDENNVPSMGRWVIVPPWFHGLMLKDDRFVKAETYPSNVVLQNGEIGKAAGFTVLKSNNVPNTAGAKYKIIAGSPIAITYAEQITSVEAFRPEQRFADALKGLHVYGARVVRPSAIAVMTASKS